MQFLRNIFGTKDEPINSYSDFWDWFIANEKDFFKVVNDHERIEAEFLDKLTPKLAELRDGFFILSGMFDENTAELVLTADGIIKNLVFVEELVDAAPNIAGWKFTAHKPAVEIEEFCLKMAGYNFGNETLSFYSNDNPDYPDEIDITITHSELNPDNETQMTAGIYIFLDNYLGEIDAVTKIDNISIVSKQDAKNDHISISKLKDFIESREQDFVEKYEGVRQQTDEDAYSMIEGAFENGNVLLAMINTDLLSWERKPSHPWVMTVQIKYDGEHNNGMPDESTFKLLGEIEDEIMVDLKDSDGYLNIGHQTANSEREIYFACKDFRKPSKILNQIRKDFSGRLEINYEIYKDKYWRSFERFCEISEK